MTMPNNEGNTFQSFMMLLGSLGRLPAPEKVFQEIQRLNNNLERLAPDLDKLSRVLDGINGSDLRQLSIQMGNLRINEMLLALGDTNSTIKNLYDRLWGKK
jgi:hypothetical protein